MYPLQLRSAKAVIAALGFLVIPLGLSGRLHSEVIDVSPPRPDRLRWERLNGDGEATWVIAARTRVPGGWLVAVKDTGVTFFPDPGHRWHRHQHPQGLTLEQRRDIYIKARFEQLKKTYRQSTDTVQEVANEHGELARDSFAIDPASAKARQHKALNALMNLRRQRNRKEGEIRHLQQKSAAESEAGKKELESKINQLLRELKSLDDQYRQQRDAFEWKDEKLTELSAKQRDLQQLKQQAADLKRELDQLESLFESP